LPGWYDAEKENAMIELTPTQLQAIEREPNKPAVVVDPRTGQQYRLIKEEVYKLMQGVVRPFNRAWDNPEDDDLIRKDL
jgi:hypothetical protein